MREIGLGMLGCGWMGRIHAQNLAALPGVRIAATYDYNPELAQNLARELGGKPCLTPKELYTQPDVDAVYICTRSDVRRELFAWSLETGKPTFCEKPMTMTLEDALWITAAVERTGLLFSMGFNQRFKPGVRLMAERMAAVGFQPAILNLSYASGPFLEGWAGLAASGGGILKCLGSHVLDLARFLVRSEVETLACFAGRLRLPAPYIEDAATLDLHFENGAMAAITVHDHSGAGYKKLTRQHLTHVEAFRAGRVFALTTNRLVEADGDVVTEHVFEPGASFAEANGYPLENAQFIEEIRTGKKLLAGVRDGLIAVRLVEAARRSVDEQRMVRLEEIPNC